jgi:hypothetical protein
MTEAAGGAEDPLPRLLAETIDVEERLRAVKAAVEAGRPRPPVVAGDRVLLASAGAAAAVLAYLGWRAGRRRAPGRLRHRHMVHR